MRCLIKKNTQIFFQINYYIDVIDVFNYGSSFNHACVLELSIMKFHIILNIPTVVSFFAKDGVLSAKSVDKYSYI